MFKYLARVELCHLPNQWQRVFPLESIANIGLVRAVCRRSANVNSIIGTDTYMTL